MSRIAASRVRLKRAYEPPAASDGTRVLIDRLWPRGVRKDAAALDLWLKDIGPSTELRKWFGHEPSRWAEFRRRYPGYFTHVANGVRSGASRRGFERARPRCWPQPWV